VSLTGRLPTIGHLQIPTPGRHTAQIPLTTRSRLLTSMFWASASCQRTWHSTGNGRSSSS